MREYRGEEVPAVKAHCSLCSLMVCKNAPWELVCHLNALFASQWKFKSCKHTSSITMAEELFVSCLQENFLKSLAGRNFQFWFSFWKTLCHLFCLRSLGSITSWVPRKFNFPFYLYWGAKTGAVSASFAIICPLQSSWGNFYGIVSVLMKEKLDGLKEI